MTTSTNYLILRFALIAFTLSGSNVIAQRVDTLGLKTIVEHEPITDPDEKEDKKKVHSTKTASIMSAIIPGLGQAYNRKYWKMPIIYAGAAVLGYYIVETNANYQDFHEAYIMRADTFSTTIDKYDEQLDNGEIKYSEGALQQLKDTYRRRRDLLFIAAGALYFLNIIDAAVDAHFYTFDISDDLSLQCRPTLFANTSSASPSAGVRFVLNL